jgi:hypothetical protein
MEQFGCSLFSSYWNYVSSWKGCPSGQEFQTGTFGGYQVRATTQQSHLTTQCSKGPPTSRLGSVYGKHGRLTSAASSFGSWLRTTAGQRTDWLAATPHPSQYPLCDQEGETINHLLTTCVFARQFWSLLLQQVGITGVSPQPHETTFEDWWRRVISLVSANIRGG